MMDKSILTEIIKLEPRVIPFINRVALKPVIKTQEYFQAVIEHSIQQVYNGYMGGEFIDIMYSLISGQLYDAYVQAWEDDENVLPLPDYLDAAYKQAVVDQQDFVQQLYTDIIDARVDQTGMDALISRAALWANRWTEAYNDAVRLINVQSGGKLVWREGDTDKKCDTCVALDGIVAYASTWDELGVHPQGGPNDKLQCNGFRCGCSLEPTDQRQSPKAYDTIMNIVSK